MTEKQHSRRLTVLAVATRLAGSARARSVLSFAAVRASALAVPPGSGGAVDQPGVTPGPQRLIQVVSPLLIDSSLAVEGLLGQAVFSGDRGDAAASGDVSQYRLPHLLRDPGAVPPPDPRVVGVGLGAVRAVASGTPA